jgi:hypothetical protein
MKAFRILGITVVATCLVTSIVLGEGKYNGVKFCGSCHKQAKYGSVYQVWEKSAHAKAFATLKTKEADEIAKKKGLSKPAAESPECLKCHVTGGGVATNVEPSFSKEEGVTCEACHGAASGWKMLHTKKENHDKAVAAGQIVNSKTDAKPCEKCHNSESPSFKGFKLAEYWAKIAHALPKQ